MDENKKNDVLEKQKIDDVSVDDLTEKSNYDVKEEYRIYDDYDEFDDDYEEIDYDKIKSKIKDATQNVMGLTDRDKYDSSYDYVTEHVAKHGIWGVISGVVVGTLAVIGQMGHVLVKNFFFGEHNSFDLGRAFRNAYEQGGLRKETRKLRNTPEKIIYDTKEDKSKEQGKENSKEQSKENSKEQSKENNKEQGEENNKEQGKENNKEEKFDPSLHKVSKELLSKKEIAKMFKDIGVIPFVDTKSNFVYLYNTRDKIDKNNIACVPKSDLVNGKVANLEKALNYYKSPRPDLKSAFIMAKIQAVRVNPQKITAFIYYQNQKIDMSINPGTKTTYTLNVGKGITRTIDFNQPMSKTLNQIKSDVRDLTKESLKESHDLGNISFQKKCSDKVEITIGEEKINVSISKESDMKQIKEILDKKLPDDKRDHTLDAFIIGLSCNNRMEKAYNEEGLELNPFTSEPLKAGEPFIAQDLALGYVNDDKNLFVAYKDSEQISSLLLSEEKTDLNKIYDSFKNEYEQSSGIRESNIQVSTQKNDPILQTDDGQLHCMMQEFILDGKSIPNIKLDEDIVPDFDDFVQQDNYEFER